VFDNVALAVQGRTGGGGGLREGTLTALARVGLEDRADQVAGTLSYGHQRLLEVAMGLALAPKLLILDEPTQGLAEGEIDGFKALVREVAGMAAVLLIEHNMDVVMDLAERIRRHRCRLRAAGSNRARPRETQTERAAAQKAAKAASREAEPRQPAATSTPTLE
jgi:energy-coupling factor transporter ATP-binding protein EcfA2